MTQKGVPFRRILGTLMTNGDSSCVSGLPGLLMSTADAGFAGMKIGGPESALQSLVSARTYVQR